MKYSNWMYLSGGGGIIHWGGGGEGEKRKRPFRLFMILFLLFRQWMKNSSGSFPFLPPSPTDKIIILSPPPLADMLSWPVWFKFLLNKVIANTCLFIFTSFSKQSASWKVLENCELCALSTDSQKTYSVNTLVAAATASTGRGGGNNPLGGRNGKDPLFFFGLSFPSIFCPLDVFWKNFPSFVFVSLYL